MNIFHLLIKGLLVLAGIIIVLNVTQVIKGAFSPRPLHDHHFFTQLQDPANIAHRGASGHYPENTHLAFEKALEKDVDALEMDVWLTADNEVVVIHDETVDRTTDGQGKVQDFTLEEIQALDAGYNFQPPNNEHNKQDNYPFRGEGLYIPTLKEVLHQYDQIPMIIELKKTGPAAARALASAIKSAGAEDRVLVASMDSATVQKLRELLPQTASAAGNSEVVKFYFFSKLGIAGWLNWEFDGLFIPPNYEGLPVLTYPFRTAARASGTHIHVWTINTKEKMEQMIEMEVQGILTDYPDRLNNVLEDTSAR